jgi:hypothetical protein
MRVKTEIKGVELMPGKELLRLKHPLVGKFKLLALLGLASGLLALNLATAEPRAVAQTTNAPAQQSGQFDQAQALAELKKQIAGKENQPATEVFKNIQYFKTNVPAGRLLAVMEIGYSKSLGVNCTHCHVPGAWDKEDKPAKQITREMAQMTMAINTDLLAKVKNLKSARPGVNCTTCHRGQVKPALNLP